MPNPERQNLALLIDAQDQQTVTGIQINPRHFSESALIKIVLRQVLRTDASTEIAIYYGEKGHYLFPACTIHKVRDLSAINQKRFLNATVSAMYDSKKVIIRKSKDQE